MSDTTAIHVDPMDLDDFPGYRAIDVLPRPDGLTAYLVLAGKPSHVFGDDIEKLLLNVNYETCDRIHLKITDASSPRYEVPESVLPRPKRISDGHPRQIGFNYTMSPFSFSIFRKSTGEVLFSTVSHPIIFKPQYIRVKTSLPPQANIYGLGEHTNPFRIPPDSTTLTFWSRDAYGIHTGTNLYGSHPVYFEHRMTGTHGVFFLNSNGMDIKITNDGPGGPSLEYNVIGGVIDLYFFAGSETDPTAVAKQYACVVGTPAEVPYWSLGLHQCRWGYKDFVDVASVISRYKGAEIPLETMWADIDFMDRRRVFTVDPDYFPMNRMQEIVEYLHAHDQKFVLITDPAVPFLPMSSYGPYERGHALDIFLKDKDGRESLSVVWPGVTVFPDWFHPDVQLFWTDEFQRFYDPVAGLDIDGAWIDMNEPTNFCRLPWDDPFRQAKERNVPPPRSTLPPYPSAPIFTDSSGSLRKRFSMVKRALRWAEKKMSLTSSQPSSLSSNPFLAAVKVPMPPSNTTRPEAVTVLTNSSRGTDLLNPPYAINNAAGALSNRTLSTDIIHANGLTEYDTHNLFGSLMSIATRNAMLARRPGKRTFVITRSTFAGAGAYVQKWLGDNLSSWEHYRNSIANMLGFATIYQVPMVGSDIGGFGGNATENLCARWATLGAFYPFMRNHNAERATSQEFYLWPTVAQAARSAIDIRYRLLDYIYTAFHQASLDGTPVLHPLWFKYPKDRNTFDIEYQFFYGDSILVSPVTEENATSVTVYLPKDIFYDFKTFAPVEGTETFITLTNVDLAELPLHIKGGCVLPLRAKSAMTTTALRKIDIEIIVAPNSLAEASGQLYVDDGESLVQTSSTLVKFQYKDQKLVVFGNFDYPLGVNVSRVRVLGVECEPRAVSDLDGSGNWHQFRYDSTMKVLDIDINQPFTHGFTLSFQ